MVTPSPRAVGTTVGTSGTSLSVTAPTCQVGDVLLAFVKADTSATMSGWSKLVESTESNPFAVFRRTAASGDSGATFTVVPTSSSLVTAGIIAYQDATDVDQTAVTSGGSTSSFAAPNVTTTHANELIVSAWGINSSAGTVTNPANSRIAYGSPPNWRLAVSDQAQSTAGITVTRTATSANSGVWSSATVTLYGSLPAPPTPSAPTSFPLTVTSSNATMSWSAVTGGSGYTRKYEISRGTSTSGPFTVLTTTTATSYTDSAPPANRPLTYRVRALSVGDESTYSGTTYSSYTTSVSNQAPNAPTLNSPASNSTIDRTVSQRFSWTFSDPDSGDSQSKADVRFSSDGGTTWATSTVNSPSAYIDMAGGTFAAGSWQWQVRTYDALGTVGPYSSSSFFTAATPPAGPTITHPTSGGYVAQSDSVTWSSSQQDAYQVQRCADNAGSIDTTTVYYDSGQVSSTTTRTLALSFPTLNRYEWVRVRVGYQGAWSAWTAVRVFVQSTPPPTATVTAVAGAPNAVAITYTLVTAAPGSGVPAATSASIAVSSDGGTTVEWSRSGVSPNSSVIFWTPATDKTYLVQVTTYSDSGISSTTGWVNT